MEHASEEVSAKNLCVKLWFTVCKYQGKLHSLYFPIFHAAKRRRKYSNERHVKHIGRQNETIIESAISLSPKLLTISNSHTHKLIQDPRFHYAFYNFLRPN